MTNLISTGLSVSLIRAPVSIQTAFSGATSRSHEVESGRELQALPTPAGSTSSVALAAREAAQAKLELERYANFPHGWDGYRGRPFDATLIGEAIALVASAAAAFSVASAVVEIVPGPASDGTVDVEFIFGARRVLVTFDPDSDNVDVLATESGRNERYSVDRRSGAVDQWLAWVVDAGLIPPVLVTYRIDSSYGGTMAFDQPAIRSAI